MPPGDRREKLLMALRPFLKPERQEKLDGRCASRS